MFDLFVLIILNQEPNTKIKNKVSIYVRFRTKRNKLKELRESEFLENIKNCLESCEIQYRFTKLNLRT